jgi:hypothetical protein
MLDLYTTKYDLTTLVKNIYAINMVDVLKSQDLDEQFIAFYILNKNYQLTDEEQKIKIDDVIKYQKHLSIEKIKIYEKLRISFLNEKYHDFEYISNINT